MRYFESNVATIIKIVFSANLHSHIVNSDESVVIKKFKNRSFPQLLPFTNDAI